MLLYQSCQGKTNGRHSGIVQNPFHVILNLIQDLSLEVRPILFEDDVRIDGLKN
jgi:hypothetical protein